MAERVLMLIDGHSLVYRGFYALQETPEDGGGLSAGRSRAREYSGDPRRIVAQHDGVLNPGAPPLVLGREPRHHRSHSGEKRGLPRV